MKLSRNIILSSVVVLALISSGCKRGEESSSTSLPTSAGGSPSLISNNILNDAPKGTFAFWTYETNSPAAQKLRASPWSANGNQRFMKALQAGGDHPLKPLFDAMERAGIVDSDPTKAPKFDRMAMFGSQGDPTLQPQLSTIANAMQGTDPAQCVQKLKAELSAPGVLTQGLSLSDATIDGTPAIKLNWQPPADPTNPNPGPKGISIVIVGKGNKLVASTSPEAAADLIKGGVPGSGVAELTSSTQFTRVTQGIALNENTMSFAYIDASKGLTALEKLGPVLFGSDVQAPTPAEAPIEAVAASASFDQALEGALQVSFTPKNESQASTLKRLSTPVQNGALQAVSGSVAGALMIDGRLLQEVLTGAKSSGQIPPEATAALAPLEGLRGFALAVKNAPANTAAVYPELVMVADSSTADQLESAIKAQLNAVVASGQAPVTPMQQSTIDGVQVNFVQSMVGVGAYLASSPPTVIIASSQSGVTDAIAASAKSKGRLADSLSAKARSMIVDASPLIMAHVDFTQVAQLVEGLQGTLAMFTGGQPLMEPTALADLRKFGSLDAGVAFKGDVLRANMLYQAPAK